MAQQSSAFKRLERWFGVSSHSTLDYSKACDYMREIYRRTNYVILGTERIASHSIKMYHELVKAHKLDRDTLKRWLHEVFTDILSTFKSEIVLENKHRQLDNEKSFSCGKKVNKLRLVFERWNVISPSIVLSAALSLAQDWFLTSHDVVLCALILSEYLLRNPALVVADDDLPLAGQISVILNEELATEFSRVGYNYVSLLTDLLIGLGLALEALTPGRNSLLPAYYFYDRYRNTPVETELIQRIAPGVGTLQLDKIAPKLIYHDERAVARYRMWLFTTTASVILAAYFTHGFRWCISGALVHDSTIDELANLLTDIRFRIIDVIVSKVSGGKESFVIEIVNEVYKYLTEKYSWMIGLYMKDIIYAILTYETRYTLKYLIYYRVDEELLRKFDIKTFLTLSIIKS